MLALPEGGGTLTIPTGDGVATAPPLLALGVQDGSGENLSLITGAGATLAFPLEFPPGGAPLALPAAAAPTSLEPPGGAGAPVGWGDEGATILVLEMRRIVRSMGWRPEVSM